MVVSGSSTAVHLIFLPRIPTGVEGTDRFLATEVEVEVAGDSGNTNVDADETEDVEESDGEEGEEGPGRARTGLGTLCIACNH